MKRLFIFLFSLFFLINAAYTQTSSKIRIFWDAAPLTEKIINYKIYEESANYVWPNGTNGTPTFVGLSYTYKGQSATNEYYAVISQTTHSYVVTSVNLWGETPHSRTITIILNKNKYQLTWDNNPAQEGDSYNIYKVDYNGKYIKEGISLTNVFSLNQAMLSSTNYFAISAANVWGESGKKIIMFQY